MDVQWGGRRTEIHFLETYQRLRPPVRARPTEDTLLTTLSEPSALAKVKKRVCCRDKLNLPMIFKDQAIQRVCCRDKLNLPMIFKDQALQQAKRPYAVLPVLTIVPKMAQDDRSRRHGRNKLFDPTYKQRLVTWSNPRCTQIEGSGRRLPFIPRIDQDE